MLQQAVDDGELQTAVEVLLACASGLTKKHLEKEFDIHSWIFSLITLARKL
jgi:hypothetical protein